MTVDFPYSDPAFELHETAVSSIFVLLGRERETQRIRDLLEDARQGRSGALVVHGEPGIGKTALLSQATALATDARVLSTVGIEGESDIPYAHLADILRPVYSEIPHIPARQAAALSSVLAIGPAEASDRFVVAAAALSLLSHLAGAAPVLIIVDDTQWIDSASREALTFVAHRLKAEGIAIVFAVREEHVGSLGLRRFPQQPLGGLGEVECRQLIGSAGGALPKQSLTRLVQETGGNPLALINLPGLLAPHQILSWTRSPEPFPVASILEEAFSHSVRALPAASRAGISLLSVLGSVPVGIFEQVLAIEGLTLDDLEAAQDARLINVVHDQPEFRHPLVRSAVYQTCPVGWRRRAHLDAAQVFADSDHPNAVERRAWHLIAAGAVADAGLARSLAEAGHVQLAARNFAAAGLLFEHAARLSPDPRVRRELLIHAAHGTRLAGSIDQSRGLTLEARTLAFADQTAREAQVAVQYLSCRLDMWAGDMTGGRDRLLTLVRSEPPVPAELAPYMLADVALASVELGQLGVAESTSRDALAYTETSGRAPSLLVVAVRALVCALRGAAAPLEVLDSRAAEVDAFDPLTVDSTEQVLLIVGIARLAAEDAERAHQVLARAVMEARSHSALGMLPFRLGRLAWVHFWRGDWPASIAASYEAVGLADDTGWHGEQSNSLVAAARVEALTGRHQQCREHLAGAMAMAEATTAQAYQAMARAVLGSLAFDTGDFPTAIEHYGYVEEFTERNGMVDTPMLWWTGDLVESLLLSDRRDEAARLLDRLCRSEVLEQRPTLAAVAARCQALAEPSRFEEHLDRALACHRRAQMPFEQARTALLLGRYLRRQRRPEARDHLTATLSTFERLGAVGWAARTRDELRAAGVRMVEPSAGLETLTAQELQIALAVARGLSNKEIAAQVFLSVKTVEYHLNKAFGKLGVSRRTQLAALVARARPLADQGSR